ncbi:hypothetical protein Dda_6093 [Drechslerella dactyloides]|uniref:Uncharacterized protein n=1 Tax=Drechslerella dactyloides TaxID=74499 RepID=A0AAD6NI79_DREDA|nr:hypothetical protein Dda_6093 [Drechslerella dactyloides]
MTSCKYTHQGFVIRPRLDADDDAGDAGRCCPPSPTAAAAATVAPSELDLDGGATTPVNVATSLLSTSFSRRRYSTSRLRSSISRACRTFSSRSSSRRLRSRIFSSSLRRFSSAFSCSRRNFSSRRAASRSCFSASLRCFSSSFASRTAALRSSFSRVVRARAAARSASVCNRWTAAAAEEDVAAVSERARALPFAIGSTSSMDEVGVALSCPVICEESREPREPLLISSSSSSSSSSPSPPDEAVMKERFDAESERLIARRSSSAAASSTFSSSCVSSVSCNGSSSGTSGSCSSSDSSSSRCTFSHAQSRNFSASRMIFPGVPLSTMNRGTLPPASDRVSIIHSTGYVSPSSFSTLSSSPAASSAGDTTTAGLPSSSASGRSSADIATRRLLARCIFALSAGPNVRDTGRTAVLPSSNDTAFRGVSPTVRLLGRPFGLLGPSSPTVASSDARAARSLTLRLRRGPASPSSSTGGTISRINSIDWYFARTKPGCSGAPSCVTGRETIVNSRPVLRGDGDDNDDIAASVRAGEAADDDMQAGNHHPFLPLLLPSCCLPHNPTTTVQTLLELPPQPAPESCKPNPLMHTPPREPRPATILRSEFVNFDISRAYAVAAAGTVGRAADGTIVSLSGADAVPDDPFDVDETPESAEAADTDRGRVVEADGGASCGGGGTGRVSMMQAAEEKVSSRNCGSEASSGSAAASSGERSARAAWRSMMRYPAAVLARHETEHRTRCDAVINRGGKQARLRETGWAEVKCNVPGARQAFQMTGSPLTCTSTAPPPSASPSPSPSTFTTSVSASTSSATRSTTTGSSAAVTVDARLSSDSTGGDDDSRDRESLSYPLTLTDSLMSSDDADATVAHALLASASSPSISTCTISSAVSPAVSSSRSPSPFSSSSSSSRSMASSAALSVPSTVPAALGPASAAVASPPSFPVANAFIGDGPVPVNIDVRPFISSPVRPKISGHHLASPCAPVSGNITRPPAPLSSASRRRNRSLNSNRVGCCCISWYVTSRNWWNTGDVSFTSDPFSFAFHPLRGPGLSTPSGSLTSPSPPTKLLACWLKNILAAPSACSNPPEAPLLLSAGCVNHFSELRNPHRSRNLCPNETQSFSTSTMNPSSVRKYGSRQICANDASCAVRSHPSEQCIITCECFNATCRTISVVPSSSDVICRSQLLLVNMSRFGGSDVRSESLIASTTLYSELRMTFVHRLRARPAGLLRVRIHTRPRVDDQIRLLRAVYHLGSALNVAAINVHKRMLRRRRRIRLEAVEDVNIAWTSFSSCTLRFFCRPVIGWEHRVSVQLLTLWMYVSTGTRCRERNLEA